MTSFAIAAGLAGLILGRVLASWIDRLPYEDVETSIRLPALGSRPRTLGGRPGRHVSPAPASPVSSGRAGRLSGRALFQWGVPVKRLRRGSAFSLLGRDAWYTRRERFLTKNQFLEEDYQRLPWYKRIPLIGLLFSTPPVDLKWYDKLPLIPYFVYAIKFSNYRALVPRHDCKNCGRQTTALDHVPLYGLLVRWLRCPRCRAHQGWLSTLIELVTAALFALFAWRFGPTWLLLGLLPLVAAFVVCATVDWQFQIIPDELNSLGVLAGLLYCGITEIFLKAGWLSDRALSTYLPRDYDRFYHVITLSDSVLGFLAGGGVLLLFGVVGTLMAGTDALGGGDIKIAGFIGAFLGWRAVLISLFYASLIGALAGSLVLWLGRGGKKEQGFTKFAFGPYICMGTLLVMYFGSGTMFFAFTNTLNRISMGMTQWIEVAPL